MHILLSPFTQYVLCTANSFIFLANNSKTKISGVNFCFPVPIIYQVNRVRDGKSFATRKVDAIQKGNVIFTLLASFQVIFILSFFLTWNKIKFQSFFSLFIVNLAKLCTLSISYVHGCSIKNY